MILKLTNGLEALIDDEDYERCSKLTWHCMSGKTLSTKYAYCWGPYPNAIMLHRFLMAPIGEREVVHHKNGNGLDCRRSNLLLTTNSVNQHARTDVKGYHWDGDRCKWKAMISVDGKAIFLGRFDHESQAAFAYEMAKARYYPELIGSEEL